MRARFIAVTVAGVVCGCSDDAAPHAAPATVANAVAESDITTITLTPEAEARLGIKLAPVERRALANTRTLGGEVAIPPGRALVMTAPVAGTVLSADTAYFPMAGAAVAAGQVMARLTPLPPDRDVSRSREDLSVAEARFNEARLESERVDKLFADRLVSAREHERVQANFRAAQATLETARAQFENVTGARNTGAGVTALTIRAPVSGIVRAVHIAPGQSVAPGTPIFEIVQLDHLWVRVPVYVGDVAGLAIDQPVTVRPLGTSIGVALVGRSVAAPPSANAAAASADLFYSVTQGARALRPGERVSVSIPMRSGAVELLVVPWSAILHDAEGGAWVYEQTRPHVYARRRVDISRIQDSFAVLARGPAPGAQIVIEGAAELFGTEFGAGH